MVDQMLCTADIHYKIVAVLGGLALVLAAITLFFASFNCINYLCRKRIKKHLIILFYVFTFVFCISMIVNDLKYMLTCEFDHLTFPEKIGFISLVGIYYTVGLSMLQLSLSIRVMLN